MSANKAKGTKWETDVVRTLNKFWRGRFGLKARRVAQEGPADTGDLHGIDPFIGQCKAWRSWEDAIREGLDGAERQKVAAKRHYGVAFVKRARKSVGEGYAVMTVATFARLLVRLRRAEDLLDRMDPAWEYHVRETTEDLRTPIKSGKEEGDEA